MGGLGVVVDVVFPASLCPAHRPARREGSLLVRWSQLVVMVIARHCRHRARPGGRPGRSLRHLLEDLQLGHVVVVLGSVATLGLSPGGGGPRHQGLRGGGHGLGGGEEVPRHFGE